MSRYVCILCGEEGNDTEVAPTLIKWLDANPRPYGAGPRCRDHDACHARVLEAGEEWPVDDRRLGLVLRDERR